MSRSTKILGHPFIPPKSFLSLAIGTESLEVKPEWKGVVPSLSDRAPRKGGFMDERDAAA